MATAKDVMKTIKENEVLFIDLRFTDTKGKEQHVSVPVKAFEDDKFELGHAFGQTTGRASRWLTVGGHDRIQGYGSA